MSEQPLLTIAIPTFNRSACLKLLLESICSQIAIDIVPRLEVLVFDNCSGDDTPAVVQGFLPGREYLRYIRNEQDIGADKNFIKAFFAARGKYVWIIGDDELLFDGAIRRVLDLCDGEEFGCAYLSSIPEVLSRMPKFLGRKVSEPVRYREYAPFAFAQAANYRLTFLSGSVVNRRGVLESNPGLNDDFERFAGFNLVHLTWILSAVVSRPVSYVVTTPLFAGTMANSGTNYNPAKIFVTNLSEIFDYYFASINPNTKEFIRWFVLIGWFPKVIFDLRFRGRYRATRYAVDAGDFPEDMRSGVAWGLFERFVLRGSAISSALAMVALKTWHRIAQWIYIKRGTERTVVSAVDPGQ